MQSSLRVLVIEDDPASRSAIAKSLREMRHTVFEAADGVTGLQIAQAEPLDAVVLDLMLPRMDGISLLKELRRTSRVPVIIVSARRTEDDRVEALDLGADDYLTKPFTVRELLARLRAVVRRTEADTATAITLGDIVIDFSGKTVSRNGARIPLTATEFEMLTALARHRGEVVPRDVLEKAIRQDGSAHVSNVVDVIILRLRRKLGRELIATRRGQGFIIEQQDGRA
ncbi:MAG: response regulator transcription factor [Planctomycetes bacterium]|nr:response regulator transcription factor [Planctomycetota bacterium]